MGSKNTFPHEAPDCFSESAQFAHTLAESVITPWSNPSNSDAHIPAEMLVFGSVRDDSPSGNDHNKTHNPHSRIPGEYIRHKSSSVVHPVEQNFFRFYDQPE